MITENVKLKKQNKKKWNRRMWIIIVRTYERERERERERKREREIEDKNKRRKGQMKDKENLINTEDK